MRFFYLYFFNLFFFSATLIFNELNLKASLNVKNLKKLNKLIQKTMFFWIRFYPEFYGLNATLKFYSFTISAALKMNA